MLTEPVPGIERVIGLSDTANKRRPVKGHAVRSVDLGIGIDQRCFSVEDQSVEIENERANHGSSKLVISSHDPASAKSFRTSCRAASSSLQASTSSSTSASNRRRRS